MAVTHCSTATWVARATSEEISRNSLAGSPCVWVFCWAAERSDVLGSVASCSVSRYKGASDCTIRTNAMKSSKKHISNTMKTGFLFCLPLDRSLRALHCKHVTPTLEIVPLGSGQRP